MLSFAKIGLGLALRFVEWCRNEFGLVARAFSEGKHILVGKAGAENDGWVSHQGKRRNSALLSRQERTLRCPLDEGLLIHG